MKLLVDGARLEDRILIELPPSEEVPQPPDQIVSWKGLSTTFDISSKIERTRF